MLSSRYLKLLLLAFLFLSLIYDQATPTFEASDEVWHYAVVRELTSGRGMPIWTAGEQTTFMQEGGQPPAYYFVSSVLTSWVDVSDFSHRFIYNPFARVGIPGTSSNVNMMAHSSIENFPWTGTTLAVRIIRWMSIVMGAVTVLLTHVLARALFPRNPQVSLLAAGFTAFNPMFLFISASVNNDNGVWLLSSIMICVVALIAAKEIGMDNTDSPRLLLSWITDRRMPWVLGFFLSLAILTKLSGLVIAPVVYILLAWRAWLHGSWRDFLTSVTIVTVTMAACTGWWFWRNYSLYGDVLATHTMIAPGVVRAETASVADLVREAPGWWLSFWGVFGAFNILSANWTYVFYTLLTVISFVGMVMWAWRARYGKVLDASAPQCFAFLFVCFSLAGGLYWARGLYASQGRLVLGAIAPISAFIAAGILGLFKRRWRTPVSMLVSAGLFIVALTIPVYYIAPRYKSPEIIEENALPANLVSVPAIFNGEFELLGYTVRQKLLRPGESIDITLYWRGLTRMDADYNLALNLHGRGYDNIGKLDTWPGGGLLPTSDWELDTIYIDRYELDISSQAAVPTVLRLDVSFWENDLSDNLLIAGEGGNPVSSLILDVAILIEHQPLIVTPTTNDGSTLGEGIILLGYDFPSKAAKGQTFPVTLYWETRKSINVNYTVFVHLLDHAGSIVSQADGPPVNGDWPTSVWQRGHPLTDAHNLSLPADLPAGEYSLIVGLYDPKSGDRVSAFTPAGEEWMDFAISTQTNIFVP